MLFAWRCLIPNGDLKHLSTGTGAVRATASHDLIELAALGLLARVGAGPVDFLC